MLPTTGQRLDDRVDIGVFHLEGEALPPYKKMDKFALPISALHPHALPRENKQYLVVGFPATKSKANPAAQELKSESISFRNIGASTSKYSELRISTESHIVINLDLKRVLMPNGSVSTFVKPAGLSGSPVWLLYDECGPNDPYQTPVVGITIEYHEPAQALIATDIEIAIKLIAAAE